ncbi:hypothetical protein [Mycobacterium uberis]|uniref:hypothetical protein n=1 Tax=Mycobacterium uberis TaxID=2162698 RepID=UPI0010585445|nr:hypothetical protein [Mycobacterium uberis]
MQVSNELDGLKIFELSTQTDVVAIIRDNLPVQLYPGRDALLNAGDTVYLVHFRTDNRSLPCVKDSLPGSTMNAHREINKWTSGLLRNTV